MPANAIRGIGRWTTEYVLALVAQRPDLVAAISVDDHLPLPTLVSRLPASVPVMRSTDGPPAAADGRLVFHALSPLEDLTIARVWPRWACEPEVALVTTLYDMIPLLFPDDYFQGGLKRLLQVRYELHRTADATIGISRTTVDDAVRLLHLDPQRAFVASGGINARFVPPVGGNAEALRTVAKVGIRPGYVLTIGNVDPRKNVFALMQAFAGLPADLRDAHQLVVTCSQGDPEHLRKLNGDADRLGIADATVVLPFVTDDLMVSLYQGCDVMVYPSLYEGLGLPLIEALACGAAVIASNVGPMREIVTTPSALFDPYDPDAITACLRSVLTSPQQQRDLRAIAGVAAARHTWERSIGEAVRAYETAAARR